MLTVMQHDDPTSGTDTPTLTVRYRKGPLGWALGTTVPDGGRAPDTFLPVANDGGRAVAQASAAAANDVLAYDPGRISKGLAADVIVFDYEKLTDKATFAKPDALSEGMRHVIVNGVLVLEDGEFTKKRPGRVLRGGAAAKV